MNNTIVINNKGYLHVKNVCVCVCGGGDKHANIILYIYIEHIL